MSPKISRALTIAGSDSGGGAGIQADLKTFTAFRVYGMSVITSVTAQNTVSVLGINDLTPDFIKLQFDAVGKDIGIDAAKTGMLSNEGIISAVASKIREYKIEKLVIDPVMVSKQGSRLLRDEAMKALIERLIPLAYIVTPNIAEAESISEMKILTIDDMKKAAQKIRSFGPKHVLVKGGHLENSKDAVDVLYDGTDFYELSALRIQTKNTHGTGCTYSAAICAGLASGFDILDSVEQAKDYVTGGIINSFALGSGHGPLNHFWEF